jgi:hypothetical protein
MTENTTLKTHADLVDRMAGTLGVDLEQAMMEGRMNVDQLGDAVLSCTGCSNPEDCRHWLEGHKGQIAEEAPGYCRNRDMLKRLSTGKNA